MRTSTLQCVQAQQSSGSGGAALKHRLLNLVLNASHAAGQLARNIPKLSLINRGVRLCSLKGLKNLEDTLVEREEAD